MSMDMTWLDFQLYMFSGFASLLASSVRVRPKTKAMSVILIFYVKLPMSMEMNWSDFQLSTDNQNGRHLATKYSSSNFFFHNSLKPGITIGFRGLRVYIGIVRFHVRSKPKLAILKGPLGMRHFQFWKFNLCEAI